MTLTVQGIDWDSGNQAKCQKHGVSLTEIEALLCSNPAIAPDPGHSRDEQRYIAVGRNDDGRAIFVAFTFRKKDGRRLIRPVSARYMHRKEAEKYDKKS